MICRKVIDQKEGQVEDKEEQVKGRKKKKEKYAKNSQQQVWEVGGPKTTANDPLNTSHGPLHTTQWDSIKVLSVWSNDLWGARLCHRTKPPRTMGLSLRTGQSKSLIADNCPPSPGIAYEGQRSHAMADWHEEATKGHGF